MSDSKKLTKELNLANIEYKTKNTFTLDDFYEIINESIAMYSKKEALN